MISSGAITPRPIRNISLNSTSRGSTSCGVGHGPFRGAGIAPRRRDTPLTLQALPVGAGLRAAAVTTASGARSHIVWLQKNKANSSSTAAICCNRFLMSHGQKSIRQVLACRLSSNVRLRATTSRVPGEVRELLAEIGAAFARMIACAPI